MVDVGDKMDTERIAIAEAYVHLPDNVASAIEGADIKSPKGPVFQTAIIAGIQAAKKTSDLIPLCHPLPLSSVTVEFEAETDGIRVTTIARCTGKTGVEMEALTATSAALLTIYDMAKAIDKGMVISGLRLLKKSGGKSGDWKAKL